MSTARWGPGPSNLGLPFPPRRRAGERINPGVSRALLCSVGSRWGGAGRAASSWKGTTQVSRCVFPPYSNLLELVKADCTLGSSPLGSKCHSSQENARNSLQQIALLLAHTGYSLAPRTLPFSLLPLFTLEHSSPGDLLSHLCMYRVSLLLSVSSR